MDLMPGNYTIQVNGVGGTTGTALVELYDLSPEELKDVPTLPGSLDDSLKALEADHDFLLKGDVFSPQLIERWISYKREKEITPLRMRPHPLEFSLYYDI